MQYSVCKYPLDPAGISGAPPLLGIKHSLQDKEGCETTDLETSNKIDLSCLLKAGKLVSFDIIRND